MMGRWCRDRENGSTTVEVAITTPMIIIFTMFLTGIGRISEAGQAVESAADQAARAASIARTASASWSDARDVAAAVLADQGMRCKSTTVTVDTSQFATPVGQRAEAVVTVTCEVDLRDVSGITGLPGSKTITRSAVSPIDTRRGRQP